MMTDQNTLTIDKIIEKLGDLDPVPRLVLLTSPTSLKVVLAKVAGAYEGVAWAELETGTNADGKTAHRWQIGDVTVYELPHIQGIYQVTDKRMIEVLEGPFWVRERL